MNNISSEEPKYKRPFFIPILVLLQLFGGVAILIIVIPNIDKFVDIELNIGINKYNIILSILFIAVLNIAAAIGTILRKKWGWWFGSFYFAHSILRYANSIYLVSEFAEDLGASPLDAEKAYFKFSTRIIINSLFFLYYFKTNVLDFFKIRERRKLILMAEVIGAAIVFFIFATVIEYFL